MQLFPSLFFVPLLLSFSRDTAKAGVSFLTSIYGWYRWLKEPEVKQGKPYVGYGPPATFWIAEGNKRAELRIPDSIPLQDTVGNYLKRRKLRRHMQKPKSSWLSPGYPLIGLATILCGLLFYRV